MNTDLIHHRLSPQEYAALMDAAKLHAIALRREAIHAFRHAVARGARAAGELEQVVAAPVDRGDHPKI